MVVGALNSYRQTGNKKKASPAVSESIWMDNWRRGISMQSLGITVVLDKDQAMDTTQAWADLLATDVNDRLGASSLHVLACADA